MQMQNCFLWLTGSLFLSLLGSASPIIAQIVPDATLPVNSLVNSNSNMITIAGGSKVGGNLFHSFQNFSIPTGGTAFFNNALDIQNIITRVTGNASSNLDGILKANGTANLFFLNPNGINFGTHAALNLGGSFLASTANRISFADGTGFSASNPQSAPLLTISTPVGLQIGQNAGAINVTGLGSGVTTDATYSHLMRGNPSSILQVAQGQSLALIGGAINIQGGVLAAPGGLIELGSVGAGNVSFNSAARGWIFDYQGVQNFSDINLSQLSLIDASSSQGGGFISAQDRNIIFTNGSAMLIENDGILPTGDITIKASGAVQFIGFSADGTVPSSLYQQTLTAGNIGNIDITSKSLLLQDGAQINSVPFATGQGGDININASDSVQVITYPTNIGAFTLGPANGGNLTISTSQLSILQGGTIINGVFGSGIGGKLTVSADNINVSGTGTVIAFNDFSTLAVSSYSSGNSGSLTINTKTLTVNAGGEVSTATFVTGNAGNLTINALKSIEVNGQAVGFLNPSQITASAQLLDPGVQQLFNLPNTLTGNSGSVTINTPKLSVLNGGLVGVNNQGTGSAGTLNINAGSIFLNNTGSINATTVNGEGGNILLQGQNIQLRRGSNITATAGGNGNGGDLNIATNILALLENSKITANAVKGRGGNIDITTQGLFTSDDSQITAVSQLGVNGVVAIKTPDLDPSKGLLNLSKSVLDASSLVGSACDRSKASSFYLTGRGGIAPQPTDFLAHQIVLADLGPSGMGHSESHLKAESRPMSKSKSLISSPILEATGWELNPQGEVVLTAALSNLTLHSLWLNSPHCLSP